MSTINFAYSSEGLSTLGFSTKLGKVKNYYESWNDGATKDKIYNSLMGEEYTDEHNLNELNFDEELDFNDGISTSFNSYEIGSFKDIFEEELSEHSVEEQESVMDELLREVEEDINEINSGLKHYDIDIVEGLEDGFSVIVKDYSLDAVTILEKAEAEIELKLIELYLEKLAYEYDGYFIQENGMDTPIVEDRNINIDEVYKKIENLDKSLGEIYFSKDLFIESVKENGFAVACSDFVVHDKDLLIKAIEVDTTLPKDKKATWDYTLYNAGNSDRDIVIKAVEKDGNELQFANSKYQDDIGVVRVAISQNPDAIKYVSERIKNDTDLLNNNYKSIADIMKKGKEKSLGIEPTRDRENKERER